MLSTQLAILAAIYVIPAAILFGGTIAVARVSRWNVLLPVERISWLLPGIVHALTPMALSRLGAGVPPKGLWNLMDPMLVAVLCWLAFTGRIAWGLKRPQSNRVAAYATIALSMAIAVAVVLYMPPLPQ
ncbi:MAG TPA: hypothetical protein VNU64_24265 [Burkholderiales bacterium]|nr:hypothetical protein [Burkholderiales bacterium]